jgi:adenine-specific DNA-methyltransferase
MATDPGDLVLDPTCGSGTTATVAEQWGRRWITIDTSRVALALARTRLMSARYPYYLLADSREGRAKEQEITGRSAHQGSTHGDIRQGFVYERVPHVTLKSIANNAEIDVIWERWQQTLEPLRGKLNAALKKSWEEWEIPREAEKTWPEAAGAAHAAWWEARIARQREIDASIARAADVELLYDRPYEDKSRVRVAGPFTEESLSPHRVIPADQQDNAEELVPAAANRRPAHHLAHLIIHGALHLAGEDHHTAGEARRMERMESRLLAKLRVPNPWKHQS